MQIDATEAQFTNPLKEYILYVDAIKVSSRSVSCVSSTLWAIKKVATFNFMIKNKTNKDKVFYYYFY